MLRPEIDTGYIPQSHSSLYTETGSSSWSQSLLKPRVLFSWCLSYGITGKLPKWAISPTPKDSFNYLFSIVFSCTQINGFSVALSQYMSIYFVFIHHFSFWYLLFPLLSLASSCSLQIAPPPCFHVIWYLLYFPFS